MNMERGIVNSLTHMLRAHGLLRRLGMPALAGCVALAAGCSGNAHIDVANSQTADPATVDFPTPPLPLATAITCLIPAIRIAPTAAPAPAGGAWISIKTLAF